MRSGTVPRRSGVPPGPPDACASSRRLGPEAPVTRPLAAVLRCRMHKGRAGGSAESNTDRGIPVDLQDRPRPMRIRRTGDPQGGAIRPVPAERETRMIMHTNVMKHSLILMLLAGAACVGSAGSAAAPAPGRVYAYAAPTAADGAARARDLLAAVAKHMRTLGSYDLRFVVETEEGATEGSCSVSGDDYVMRLGRAEIYGSPAVRYEVDNVRREVTVESNDGSRTDILSNPARAFDLAGEAFDALLVRESGGESVVRLTPRAGQRGLSADAHPRCGEIRAPRAGVRLRRRPHPHPAARSRSPQIAAAALRPGALCGLRGDRLPLIRRVRRRLRIRRAKDVAAGRPHSVSGADPHPKDRTAPYPVARLPRGGRKMRSEAVRSPEKGRKRGVAGIRTKKNRKFGVQSCSNRGKVLFLFV